MTYSRLLQHRSEDGTRRVILAEGEDAHALSGPSTTLELTRQAIADGTTLPANTIVGDDDCHVPCRKI